ncbi:MAG: hypothetical protein RRY42_03285 [Mucinivorans sp.]
MKLLLSKLFVFVTALPLILTSCVNKAFDIKNVNDINTDISIGGEHMAIPLGTLETIKLGDFLKPSDILSVVDNKYEFKYAGTQSIAIPAISPITITPSIPAIPSSQIDLAQYSIDNINLPTITINATATPLQIPAGGAGLPVSIDNIMAVGESPINIRYTFDSPLAEISWVTLGSQLTGRGQEMRLAITPDYGGTMMANPRTVINRFSITFPYGFELALKENDPYGATLSPDKKTITIVGKTLTSEKIDFYVKKITFNPAIDQTTKGELNYNGSIKYACNLSVDGLSSGAGGLIKVDLSAVEKLTLNDGLFSTTDYRSSIAQVNTAITINERLSSPEIVSLRSADFTQQCMLAIKVNLEGLPRSIKNVTLKNYRIKFPDFMVFKDETINKSKELIINDIIEPSIGLTKEIEITGLVFANNPITSGAIKINGNIVMGGQCEIPAATLQNSDIQAISLAPRATIDKINFGTVVGVIDTKLKVDPWDVKIDLGKELSFLQNSTLDLSQVILKFGVNNPTGITADIGLTINPYDENQKLIASGVVSQPQGITVQGNATSKIWFSNLDYGKPQDYNFVKNTDLPKVFRTMPSKIEVLLDTKTDRYESTINLGQQYPNLKLAYDIVAPLTFGSEFELIYSDKIKNLQKDLNDFLGYTSILILDVAVDNSVPLELTLGATPLGSKDESIGVSITVDGVIAPGSKDGAFVNSKIVLTLKETTPGDLAKLDQIKLTFTGQNNKAVAGASLKDDQSLKVKVSARIPGGINIKDKNKVASKN